MKQIYFFQGLVQEKEHSIQFLHSKNNWDDTQSDYVWFTILSFQF